MKCESCDSCGSKAMQDSFHADIGSVSSGTLQPRDLIPTFICELDCLKESESLSARPNKERFSGLDNELGCLERREKRTDYYDSADAIWDLDWLFDALEEYSPPGCYFGAHEGDGADFGFWQGENDEV